MKDTRKNKRFRKRNKQTKRNNYRKKRPTGGGILSTIGIGENARHKGKNGLLLDFNICGKRDSKEQCNNYMEDPVFGYKYNDGFLNTGYNIENGKFLSTEPFDNNNRTTKFKLYESYEIIYDKTQNTKKNLNDDNSKNFLEKNQNIEILFKINFIDETNGVIIVKSYEKKYYNDRYSYIYVVVDTDSNLKLKGQKVGGSEVIELYRKRGDLKDFRNYTQRGR